MYESHKISYASNPKINARFLMINLVNLPEWQALQDHKKKIENTRMQDLFAENPNRFSEFSIQFEDVLFDFSKNRITEETLKLLLNLTKAINLPSYIHSLFSGENINLTEKRPALHTALRNPHAQVLANGKNISALVQHSLEKMQDFSEKIRHHTLKGCTNKPFTDIINIGIGGSHLGPLTTTHALKEFAIPTLRCHFISNVDSAHVNDVLSSINPETSLFIISSKSFTTLETLTNANTIKQWFKTKVGEHGWEKHFVAVTAAASKAMAFGIPENHIFPLWDWVGGRYSIWSAIGLPLILLIGMKNFRHFLEGAYAMDRHFQQAQPRHNIPIIMALISLWYINFFDANNHAILPYSHLLHYVPMYIQQADMESNGKTISRQGKSCLYKTGPIIWGDQGCNGQHAFYQSLHQGSHFTPVDFILTGATQHSLRKHQDILVSSGLSQAQALMQGKSSKHILAELIDEGYTQQEAEHLSAHKTIPGNQPSNILFIKKISPYNLGVLLSLYEHKIFVQGAIWNINSFDQWGVELGKELMPSILSDIENNPSHMNYDSSTQALISYYKKIRSDV